MSTKVITDPSALGWEQDGETPNGTPLYQWSGGQDMGPIKDGDTEGQITTWDGAEWTPDSSLTIGATGDATFSGNVEVGITDAGGLKLQHKTRGGAVEFGLPGVTASTFGLYTNDGTNKDLVYRASPFSHEFSTGPAGSVQTRLTIDSTGNATFSGRINAVNGYFTGTVERNGANPNYRMTLSDNSRSWDMTVKPDGALNFLDRTAGADRLTIDATGNATFTGAVNSKGFGCRAGTLGATTGNNFNIQWGNVGGAAELWIDSARVGTISTTTRTAQDLIKTLSTLRQATMDETQDIRESLRSAIDELVEGFEQEIATMPAPEEA